MLVYAINDRKSFEIVQTIHDKIVECVGDINVPVVLVGNKLDLQYACRAVSREEGETLARKWNAWFVEISARDHHASVRYRVNHSWPNEVNEIFERAILAIEIAKSNFNYKGKPIICPGSTEGRCSLM
ncbi:hypothetical protein PENTCL1PPCAC_24635 [Pristionchus entomophagus]|uniref:ADP ribosylation factor n=1 Tax=Pristionchus entomophagus TaxID=358040 RepID=A0AAV5U6F3_9BILA|nr:hypothetical protein PENTCL1PPCAC_24635 [Pristionchus entomophagus]